MSRYLGAAVGELEIHAEAADEQTRSLFHYGLMAVASGPANQLSQETAEGISAIFVAWDQRIGDGCAPPWRVAADA